MLVRSPSVTVLIVDDHADIRYLVRVVVERDGAEVVGEAGTAAVGVELWRRLRPDVVVMDHLLPDGSGLDAAEQILDEDPSQAVIVFSTFLGDEPVARARRIGVRECVDKGDVNRLPLAVREHGHRLADVVHEAGGDGVDPVAALINVRFQLRSLASQRIVAPASTNDGARWARLCAREEALLKGGAGTALATVVSGRVGHVNVLERLAPILLMQRVADQVLGLCAAAEGVLVGVSDSSSITYVCGAGYLASALGTRTALESSIGGLAARTGKVLRCDDTETDARVDRDACRRLGTLSTVCVPLARGTDLLGILAVGATRRSAFSDHDVATFTAMADLISVAIGIARDLDRVSAEITEFAHPEVTASGSDVRSTNSAGRFLMNVLDPGAVPSVDARRRVQAVLGDPATLSVVFQPIMDLESDTVVAVEALSRFDLPIDEAASELFVDACNVGLGVELEMLAVTKALACLPLLPDGMLLTINAGPETVLTSQFLDAICATGEAERVVVELTEHSAVGDYPDLVAAIARLRRRQVQLAVDDAGAGFSSLAHILRLAPDFIKLDRELITGIDLDPVRRALATALVTFAAETGARVLAEGIETEDELDVVRSLGVRYGQGYHIGRPAPIDTLADALADKP